jgi:formamidopyrimidine-DNA glycosylase
VFAGLLQPTKRIIKAVLLDQTVLAGIGNIYADEALWRAQIHPQLPANQVSSTQATLLLDAIQTVLRQALTNGGSTLRDYRDSYGAQGTQHDNFMAYDRTNQPCMRCGTLIVKTKVAQRGTHFCPQCQ